ncbi:energy-coupling factor ABC transporter ATP-binding protein [Alkalibacter mobilis]|uniref:energy-coupling factor ABC transporter ATP-binding protein n=1 Tax=Alkalibacter mobilis TaxID=2787712 RepID=UPI0018A0ABE5|nr:ABC transporter ATP-binding protein [Alkalibacter mobilis]MBF7096393.1 ABC transporter ATP-binding protein [Alkalibacter mobilis]
MSHHKIDIKDLDYMYPDGKKAVNGFSINITHGESVALVGANGAGKSTLLSLMVGILMPQKGEIIIGDTHLSKETLPLLRQKIGMTFQNADDQLFMNSVYEDVAFGPRNYKLNEEEVDARVIGALKKVDALHLKDRPPYKLSGGEKRAVSIATALSLDPDILLMDEPTAALDPKSRRRLIGILKEFAHTKIIATHDLDMALDVCDRTIVMNQGTVVADGRTKDIMVNDELLEKCSLERPLILQGQNN